MKTLALVGMVLAHTFFAVGYPFINYAFFFWVAPLFAVIVGINAFNHSRNPLLYSRRLLFWALISQPVHLWFFGFNWWYVPNILFGLSAACFIVGIRDKIPEVKLPPIFFYAFYPFHFIVIKILADTVLAS